MSKKIIIKTNRGMTYVELIVVLSIFAILSTVVIFNYGDFQARVDIRNLSSDIALKVVEAQKSSLSGLLPPLTQQSQLPVNWKPTYGVYFSAGSNQTFYYFVDINQDGLFNDTSCSGGGECLNKISITRGNFISSLDAFYKDGTSMPLSDLTITFARPNSGAVIHSSSSVINTGLNYVQVTIDSPKGAASAIQLYPSGRVQISPMASANINATPSPTKIPPTITPTPPGGGGLIGPSVRDTPTPGGLSF